jgi:hypothetical protein
MANAWLAHVKKTMRSHKGKKFGQVLKIAKSSYKKHGKRGGASESDSSSDSDPKESAMDSGPSKDMEMSSDMPDGGRRRRRRSAGRRTRRHRRR